MSVSVVIPAYNYNDLLLMTLGCVEKQLSEVDEVIVVDDGSDPPLEVPQWVRLERIERPASHRSAAPARNECHRLASCDYVISLDSTMLFTSDTFASMKANMAEMEQEIGAPMVVTLHFFGVRRTLTPDEVPDVDRWMELNREAIMAAVPERWYEVGCKEMDQNVSMMKQSTWDLVGGCDDEQFKSWGFENQDFMLRLFKLGGMVNSLVPRIGTKDLLFAFHNYHDEERDTGQARSEFAAKWGQPYDNTLANRMVDLSPWGEK